MDDAYDFASRLLLQVGPLSPFASRLLLQVGPLSPFGAITPLMASGHVPRSFLRLLFTLECQALPFLGQRQRLHEIVMI